MANTKLMKKKKGVIGANGFNNDAGKILILLLVIKFHDNYRPLSYVLMLIVSLGRANFKSILFQNEGSRSN